MQTPHLPTVIQGGMGAGVSGWRLARAVSIRGQLGVVAGTALDVILLRRLQLGDAGGHLRRALASFPIPGVARRIFERYYIEGGKKKEAAFKPLPLLTAAPSSDREELIVAANFAEVFLAKEGHAGVVGINFLAKIQLPTLPSIFGAMLAGVDYVLIGAGIPRAIPSILDDLAAMRAVQLPIEHLGAKHGTTEKESAVLSFDPGAHCRGNTPLLRRPAFLAIVSSVTVASVMVRKASGTVDGLIIEGPTAGGHNAPPRGHLQLDDSGEPIFGERDQPDLAAIQRLGVPFWLAGSHANPDALQRAINQGATGIQVGTAFAFCDESGLEPALKRRALAEISAGTARVRTDPLASPTGFPFKVFQLEGTLSEKEAFEDRVKVCDLGYLRHGYVKPDGRLAWRCPGEPDDIFIRKGGQEDEIQGRKCVCNGLLANIGLAQTRRDGAEEAPLLTSGTDLAVVAELMSPGSEGYPASKVLEHLLQGTLSEA